MRDPQQLPCGHDCGASCVGADLRCAVESCQVDVSSIHPIGVAARMIAKLITTCEGQCGWKGTCAELQGHLCPLETVQCPFKCGAEIPREALPHHTSMCTNRMEDCPNCFQKFRVQDLCLHTAKCPLGPIQCSGCGSTVKRSQLPNHIEHHCTEKQVACPFQEFGCATLIPRRELRSHVSDALSLHCEILVAHVQQEKQACEKKFVELHGRIKELEDALEGSVTVRGVPVAEAIRLLDDKLTAQEVQAGAILEGRLLTVDPSGHCGHYRSISAALGGFRSGDCLVLRPGVYTETVELTAAHAGLTLRGAGREVTFISGRLIIRTDCSIQDISVMNRLDRDAPAVRVTHGSPVFLRTHITSVNLSCVVVDGGAPTLTDCMISGSKQHGVLWRSENSSGGSINGCALSDCSESIVCIERGSLAIHSCDLFGSGSNGLSVLAKGQCSVTESALHDNQCSNVECRFGGSIRMERCSVFRSAKCGVFLCGEATIEASKIFENQLPNAFIVGGASVLMTECKLLCGLQHGIVVKRDGFLRLSNCVVSGNCLENVVIEEGAVVV